MWKRLMDEAVRYTSSIGQLKMKIVVVDTIDFAAKPKSSTTACVQEGRWSCKSVRTSTITTIFLPTTAYMKDSLTKFSNHIC